MWETTSQSSYNALAQSFRARKMSSDPSALAQALAKGANAIPPALPSAPAAPAQPDPRLAELEAQIAERNAQLDEANRDREKLERENRKNTEVLGRYRDQWEKLKAGARKRDLEKRAARTKVAGESARESDQADKEEEEEVLDEEPGFGKA
jgi:chromosome segregation ATPase